MNRLARFIALRLLQMIPLLLVVSIILFAITNLLPGDPTHAILGDDATEAQRELVRERYGLNDPAPVRYVRWMGQILTGDLGRSLNRHEYVSNMLAARVPITFQLAFMSIALAALIGVPAGIVAARWQGSWVDFFVSFFAMISLAMPYFWAAILLILLFALRLGWLPSSGYVPFSEDPVKNLQLMVLPTITIGTAFAGLIMRQVRGAMLQVLSEDYMRTARAKGLGEFTITIRHGLRNALIPVVTVIGLQIGALLGGTVVVETVFSMPGLGKMIVDGIYSRDIVVVQGAVLFSVLCVMTVNLLVDIIYAAVDPRITY